MKDILLPLCHLAKHPDNKDEIGNQFIYIDQIDSDTIKLSAYTPNHYLCTQIEHGQIDIKFGVEADNYCLLASEVEKIVAAVSDIHSIEIAEDTATCSTDIGEFILTPELDKVLPAVSSRLNIDAHDYLELGKPNFQEIVKSLDPYFAKDKLRTALNHTAITPEGMCCASDGHGLRMIPLDNTPRVKLLSDSLNRLNQRNFIVNWPLKQLSKLDVVEGVRLNTLLDQPSEEPKERLYSLEAKLTFKNCENFFNLKILIDPEIKAPDFNAVIDSYCELRPNSITLNHQQLNAIEKAAKVFHKNISVAIDFDEDMAKASIIDNETRVTYYTLDLGNCDRTGSCFFYISPIFLKRFRMCAGKEDLTLLLQAHNRLIHATYNGMEGYLAEMPTLLNK